MICQNTLVKPLGVTWTEGRIRLSGERRATKTSNPVNCDQIRQERTLTRIGPFDVLELILLVSFDSMC